MCSPPYPLRKTFPILFLQIIANNFTFAWLISFYIIFQSICWILGAGIKFKMLVTKTLVHHEKCLAHPLYVNCPLFWIIELIELENFRARVCIFQDMLYIRRNVFHNLSSFFFIFKYSNISFLEWTCQMPANDKFSSC